MNYEITEVIPQPELIKLIDLTLNTEELGLIVWAINMSYDKYSHGSDYRELREQLIYIEEVAGGRKKSV